MGTTFEPDKMKVVNVSLKLLPRITLPHKITCMERECKRPKGSFVLRVRALFVTLLLIGAMPIANAATYVVTKTARRLSLVGFAWCLVLLLTMPGIAEAATCPVISSFPSPGGNNPDGLTWDGTHLWLSGPGTDQIYKLTTAGAVVTSFPAPGLSPKGIAWDGTNLWVASDTDDRVYQITTTGSVISSFPLTTSDPFGMTWDGTHLWVVDDVTLRIYKFTTTGTLVSSFVTPGTTPRGLTWDGTNLWHTDTSTDVIYQLTTIGNVLDSCPTPNSAPRGLTLDGANFWLGDSGSGLVYQLGGLPPRFTVSGTVFEDVNYGGGMGRDRATAAADAPSFTVGRGGVTVELYASGNFVTSTATVAGSGYSFTVTPGTYTVRVVNGSVTSSRPGSDGSELAVQTYRSDGVSEGAGDGAKKVGGELPSNEDAAANSGAQTLASLQGTDLDSDGITEWTQSIVTVDASGGDVSGVDFGFNFDVVVNTNNSGQGSLRQFIINSNLLSWSGDGQRAEDEPRELVFVDSGVAYPRQLLRNLLSGYRAASLGRILDITSAKYWPFLTAQAG
jgi:hypothetical protein